uniref:Probable serine/threonine-protein kinase kinX-like n=1 Tax=Saccoglossus kowalevskii TaxID=10224 RepID=A0ABM0MZN1_SACKO|nr:PREDICTED: probable serine/threonine-protein kinase kinX-like [Saccoglossus kowalevskii]
MDDEIAPSMTVEYPVDEKKDSGDAVRDAIITSDSEITPTITPQSTEIVGQMDVEIAPTITVVEYSADEKKDSDDAVKDTVIPSDDNIKPTVTPESADTDRRMDDEIAPSMTIEYPVDETRDSDDAVRDAIISSDSEIEPTLTSQSAEFVGQMDVEIAPTIIVENPADGQKDSDDAIKDAVIASEDEIKPTVTPESADTDRKMDDEITPSMTVEYPVDEKKDSGDVVKDAIIPSDSEITPTMSPQSAEIGGQMGVEIAPTITVEFTADEQKYSDDAIKDAAIPSDDKVKATLTPHSSEMDRQTDVSIAQSMSVKPPVDEQKDSDDAVEQTVILSGDIVKPTLKPESAEIDIQMDVAIAPLVDNGNSQFINATTHEVIESTLIEQVKESELVSEPSDKVHKQKDITSEMHIHPILVEYPLELPKVDKPQKTASETYHVLKQIEESESVSLQLERKVISSEEHTQLMSVKYPIKLATVDPATPQNTDAESESKNLASEEHIHQIGSLKVDTVTPLKMGAATQNVIPSKHVEPARNTGLVKARVQVPEQTHITSEVRIHPISVESQREFDNVTLRKTNATHGILPEPSIKSDLVEPMKQMKLEDSASEVYIHSISELTRKVSDVGTVTPQKNDSETFKVREPSKERNSIESGTQEQEQKVITSEEHVQAIPVKCQMEPAVVDTVIPLTTDTVIQEVIPSTVLEPSLESDQVETIIEGTQQKDLASEEQMHQISVDYGSELDTPQQPDAGTHDILELTKEGELMKSVKPPLEQKQIISKEHVSAISVEFPSDLLKVDVTTQNADAVTGEVLPSNLVEPAKKSDLVKPLEQVQNRQKHI